MIFLVCMLWAVGAVGQDWRVAMVISDTSSVLASDTRWRNWLLSEAYIDTVVFWDRDDITADSMNSYDFVWIGQNCDGGQITICKGLNVPVYVIDRQVTGAAFLDLSAST